MAASPILSAWDTITLEPSQDNTLYETAMDQEGQQVEMSNGAGSSLFIGRTGLDAAYKRRRALVRFDLEGKLPKDAVIVWAEFSMHQTKAAPNSPPAPMGLHPVLQSWGEGDSNAFGPEGQGNFAEPGDATWHHNHYPDSKWTSDGGQFGPIASTTITVGRDLARITGLAPNRYSMSSSIGNPTLIPILVGS